MVDPYELIICGVKTKRVSTSEGSGAVDGMMHTARLHFFLRCVRREVEYLMRCGVQVGRVRVWVSGAGGTSLSEVRNLWAPSDSQEYTHAVSRVTEYRLKVPSSLQYGNMIT
jgi:hypothetical protein